MVNLGGKKEEEIKPDESGLCGGHILLKKKAKLALWELDEKTLKHMYRKTAKEKAESRENQKIPHWKSEYDDMYNRTAQTIIRSIKLRQYRRKKALKLNNSRK